MRRLASILLSLMLSILAAPLPAQDLGPHVRKIADGIYVYAAQPADSNVSIIMTAEGPVLIDTARRPRTRAR